MVLLLNHSIVSHYFGVMQSSKLIPKRAVIFDTFTTDIIVDGATCGSTCSGKSLYDIAGSTTGKNLGEQAEAIFGGGSANGNLVSEVVTVAGNTVSRCSY